MATHFGRRVKKVFTHNGVVLSLPNFDDSRCITSADFLKIHIHVSGWCHNERIAKKRSISVSSCFFLLMMPRGSNVR